MSMGFIHEMGDTGPSNEDVRRLEGDVRRLEREVENLQAGQNNPQMLDATLKMILERLAKLERRPDANDAALRMQCLELARSVSIDADKMVEAADRLFAFVIGARSR